MKDFHQATAASRQQINVIFKGGHASTEQRSDCEYQGDSGPSNVFILTSNRLVPNDPYLLTRLTASNLITSQKCNIQSYTLTGSNTQNVVKVFPTGLHLMPCCKAPVQRLVGQSGMPLCTKEEQHGTDILV